MRTQAAIAELMTLGFLETATNALLVGPSGLGKTTIAQNIAHQAVLAHLVLFTTAGQLLGELAALDSDSALRRRLRRLTPAPTLLVIDEVGYLSSTRTATPICSSNSSAVATRKRAPSSPPTSPLPNRSEVFPNAACVVALIDRLVHHAEIIALKGLSWRHKEAQERAATNARKRKSARIPHEDRPPAVRAAARPGPAHRRRLDARAGPGRDRAARRSARAHLGTLQLALFEHYRQDRLTQAELPFDDPSF